jgi:hypothetical protein
VSQRLLNCLRRKQIVRLILHDNLGHAPFGLPVALSSTWVILVFFRDFRADGYSAVPLHRIKRITTGRYERAYTRICAADGLLTRCKPPRTDLGSLIGLLATLQRTRKPITLNAASTTATGQVTLGRLVGVSDESILIRPFDAAAEWLRGTRSVPLADLLDIQWDSHSLRTYARHLPPLPGDPGGA